MQEFKFRRLRAGDIKTSRRYSGRKTREDCCKFARSEAHYRNC